MRAHESQRESPRVHESFIILGQTIARRFMQARMLNSPSRVWPGLYESWSLRRQKDRLYT